MSGFLYCFIGEEFKNAPSDEQLKEMKLDHLMGVNFSQAGYLGSERMAGEGVICAIAQSELGGKGHSQTEGGQEPKVGYYPDTQEWQKGGEKWWIGWEKDNPPTTADLSKPDWISGHKVKMGNDEIYIIPPERFLPKGMELDENMVVQWIPLSRFDGIRNLTAKLYADFGAYVEVRAEGEELPEEQMSGAEQMQVAIYFIGLNYRIGRVEVNALGLLTDKTLLMTLCAVWNLGDMDAMVKEMNEMAAAKKKRDVPAAADISIVEGGGVS